MIKLQKSQELHQRIGLKQLQVKQKIVDLVEKYQKIIAKNKHQNKDKKILMI